MTSFNSIINIASDLGCRVLLDTPMSEVTTFKIGGPAKVFISPDSVNQTISILSAIKDINVPYFVLGKGSNIVVSDTGFNGVVLCTTEMDKCTFSGNGVITCDAGIKLHALCRFALENCLTGIEFAYGIPGTAGGAVYMNAGAYNGEMKNVVIESTHINSDLSLGTYTNSDLQFDYRNSIYKGNKCIITSLSIQLSHSDKVEIESKMNEFMKRRKETQPLDFPSAGSVFKRPEGNYAAALIQECGLKGFSVGGAKVSEKHSGFIINTGRATSDDIKRLVEIIKNTVFNKCGIILETEIEFL